MLWLFFVLSTLLQQTSATGWTLLLRCERVLGFYIIVWPGKLMEQAGFPILTGTGMHITQTLNCLGQTCKTQYIREGLPKKWK